ncbi:hypothetical protein G7Y89_g1359 [Cudoniella acicularis]|uniref:Glucose/galactose transporter n=1 Tax=Cudoniella acicularis TaxID=354080 RepID=A0A8H4RYC2_9HELO|nr:hypothetical protein G7Y89_g1359 [Cudoniella acicularis]
MPSSKLHSILQQRKLCSGLTGYIDKPMGKQYKLMFWSCRSILLCWRSAANFINYAREFAGISAAAASDRYAIGQGLFVIGRFAAAGLMMFVKLRLVLAFMTAIVTFIAAAIGVHGEGGVAMLSLVLFFESCIFPTIFTLSIRGLGRHTKRGSSWIVASVSGGALFPSLTGLPADRKDYHVSMAVPLCGFFVAFAYPIYLNVFCRKELDGFRETKIGYVDSDGVVGDPDHELRRASVRHEEKGLKAGDHLEE